MGPHLTEKQTQDFIEAARKYNRLRGFPEVLIGYTEMMGAGPKWLGRVNFTGPIATIAWEEDYTPGREIIRDIPLKPLNAKPEKK